MKRSRLISLFFAGFALVTVTPAVLAQDTSPIIPEAAPGNPASSYALSGIDNVNYYNGSMNIHVPVATIGARGSVSKTLVVPIQRIWSSTDPSVGGASDFPFSSLVPVISGWPYSLGYLSVETSSQGSLVCTNSSNITEWAPTASGNGNSLTWLVWHAPDLTETVLVDVKYDGQAQAIGGTDCGSSYAPASRGNVFRSYDGSGITYVANAAISDGPVGNGFSTQGTIYLKDGTRYTVNQYGVPTAMEDRNGNISTWVFTSTYSGGKYAVTDSAGRVTTFTFTEDLSSQSYDTITWNGTSGAGRTITVNYAELGSSGVTFSGAAPQDYSCLFPEFTGATGSPFDPWVVKSIVLPDMTQYSFQYNVYGEVVNMTLPTGGTVHYTYGGSSCARTADSSLSASAGYSSGALIPGSGPTSIYRPLYERDEYANGGTTPTAKTIFTPSAGVPAASETQVKIQFEDGSGSPLKTEYHDFLGEPTSSTFIPTDPTQYPGWNDGFEFQSSVVDPTSGTLLTRQTVVGQRPCAGTPYETTYCALQSASDTLSALPPHDPQICQIGTTMGTAGSGPMSGVTFGYDQYNNQTDMREFDYGAGPGVATTCPTTLTGYSRDTATTYNGSSTYTTVPSPIISGSPANQAYMVSLPASRTVTDGSSTTAAEDTWTYDEYGTTGHPAIASSAQPGHDDTNYGTSNLVRGNVTTHTVYNTTTSTASETFAYDQSGSVVSYNDFNTNQTTFGYDSAIHVGPQTLTNPLGSSIGQRSYQYDPNTLKVTSMIDENHAATTYSYVDPLDRLTNVQRGAVTKSNTAYVYTGTTEVTTKQDQVTSTDAAIQADAYYDLFGRPNETVQHENSSQSLVSTQTYDALGRVASTTDPQRGGGGPETSYTYL